MLLNSDDTFISYLYPKVESWKRIKSDLFRYYNKEWFKMDRFINPFGQKTKNNDIKRKELDLV